MMQRSPLADHDGVEIAHVARTLGWQWRVLAWCVALGLLAGLAVQLFAPRRFEGRATLLARGGSADAGSSILGRMGNLGELISGGGLDALGFKFESELEVLQSRAVVGAAVDSLQLQFSVRDPAGVPPSEIVAASALPGRFAPRTYEFERLPTGEYEATAGDRSFRLVPGTPGAFGTGTVTLRRSDTLPAAFRIRVYDREDAITRQLRRIEATKAGGDVAEIIYRGEDSLTAAAVPNVMVANYLERRKTVDRGVNQRRVEYVSAQLATTAAELAATERALREHQEASGIFNAELVGVAELEGAIALRESLTVVQVEESALKRMLARNRDGDLTPEQLAAYPTFIRGTAFNALVDQLTEARGRRIALLERRTVRDPEVLAIDETIRALQAQIRAMVESYAQGIATRRADLARVVDSLQGRLLALPAAAERGGRMQRDIARLTAIYTALQAQLVEARLAAIGEGGDVRQIDVAVPPRRAAFPRPVMTLGVGTFAGLLVGTVAALLLGWYGRWVGDPVEIERLTGVAVQRIDPRAPLILVPPSPRTVLVIPLGPGARTDVAAQRLAQTAAARLMPVRTLDLRAGGAPGAAGNGAGPGVAARIAELEQDDAMLVVELPDLSSEMTVAALKDTRPVLFVAPPGRVDRVQLAGAFELLRRLGVPCVGVALSDASLARVTAS